jgi:hypothetical protein
MTCYRTSRSIIGAHITLHCSINPLYSIASFTIIELGPYTPDIRILSRSLSFPPFTLVVEQNKGHLPLSYVIYVFLSPYLSQEADVMHASGFLLAFHVINLLLTHESPKSAVKALFQLPFILQCHQRTKVRHYPIDRVTLHKSAMRGRIITSSVQKFQLRQVDGSCKKNRHVGI